MVAKAVNFLLGQCILLILGLVIKLFQPFSGQVHDHGLVRQPVFRIVDDRGEFVPGDQENIPCPEAKSRFCLYDFCFSRDEPDQHVVIKHQVGFEQLVPVAGKLDVFGQVFGYVPHCDNVIG